MNEIYIRRRGQGHVKAGSERAGPQCTGSLQQNIESLGLRLSPALP